MIDLAFILKIFLKCSVSLKKAEKVSESLRTASARLSLEKTTDRSQYLTPQRVKIFSFQNDLGSAGPKAAFGLKTKLRTKLELLKIQFVRGPKIILKCGVRNRGVLGRPTDIVDMQWCQLAPKPLVLNVSRTWTSCALDRHRRKSKDFSKSADSAPSDSCRRKGGPQSAKMPQKKKRKMNARLKGNLQNTNPNFAQQNKWFQKPRAAN